MNNDCCTIREEKLERIFHPMVFFVCLFLLLLVCLFVFVFVFFFKCKIDMLGYLYSTLLYTIQLW